MRCVVMKLRQLCSRLSHRHHTAHHLRHHVSIVTVRLLLHFAKNEQEVDVGVIQMVTRSKGQQVEGSGRRWALKLNSQERNGGKAVVRSGGKAGMLWKRTHPGV